jgi:hypothetical protein
VHALRIEPESSARSDGENWRHDVLLTAWRPEHCAVLVPLSSKATVVSTGSAYVVSRWDSSLL